MSRQPAAISLQGGEPPSPRPYGVPAGVAVTAIVCVALCLRPAIVSVGPILPDVIKEFRLSHAGASLLTAIPDILMGLFAIPAAIIANRLGRNAVLIGALLLLGISTVGRALAQDAAELLLATAGVGAGIAVAGALMGGFIKARFPAQAALVMGVYATSLSLGSTVAAAATGPTATAFGWRGATAMWGGVSAIAALVWLIILRSERLAAAPVAQPGGPAAGLPWKNRTAWLIAIYFACNNLLFYALLAWLVPLYHEAGWTTARAGLVLASFTAVFMIANPLFGWLSKSEDRRVWLVASAGLCLAGLVPIALAPELAPFIFVPLAAFGLGGVFTLAMTLPLDNTATPEAANAWTAFTMMIGYLVAALGPVLTGLLRDLTGDYTASLWMLCGAAALMLAIAPMLRPHHHLA